MSAFLLARKSSLLMRLQIAKTLGNCLRSFWSSSCDAEQKTPPLLLWFFAAVASDGKMMPPHFIKSAQRSIWKFWKMFWCRGYVGTTTPSKWCSFKTLRPRMEPRKFRIYWRRIFLWWSRRIFDPAAPQIIMFVTIGCLASLRESLM